MSSQPFRFKQFTIHQDRCAMKVGTDGVLLGAWTEISPSPMRILDVGTGTGLIALMLAQRTGATIDAIEINDEAAKQSAENFKASPWAERLTTINTSLQEYDTDQRYDLIVSNPPYFESAKGIETEGRTMARHTGSLRLDELVSKAATLLKQEGSLALIVPIEEEGNLVAIGISNGMYPSRICRVKGNEQAKTKRLLVQFSRQQKECEYSELVIESDRHVYTEAYKQLCKDFYLAK